jgi:hypothetical protein
MALFVRYTMKHQGGKRPWQLGRLSLIGQPKGGFMVPMKRPIRLLGMVFQVDRERP